VTGRRAADRRRITRRPGLKYHGIEPRFGVVMRGYDRADVASEALHDASTMPMTLQPFPRTTRWPARASVLGGAFAHLILQALTDPSLISYTGWYMDDLERGPIWHRWWYRLDKKKDASVRVGVAFLSALYALADHGIVEFTTARGEDPRVRAGFELGDDRLLGANLEAAIVRCVHRRGEPSIKELLADAIPPSAPRRRDRADEWLQVQRMQPRDSEPEQLAAALELAARFVELEAGLGLEGPDQDQLEDLLAQIELASLHFVAEVF
jgi:hypothetical protein